MGLRTEIYNTYVHCRFGSKFAAGPSISSFNIQLQLNLSLMNGLLKKHKWTNKTHLKWSWRWQMCTDTKIQYNVMWQVNRVRLFHSYLKSHNWKNRHYTLSTHYAHLMHTLRQGFPNFFHSGPPFQQWGTSRDIYFYVHKHCSSHKSFTPLLLVERQFCTFKRLNSAIFSMGTEII